MSSTIYETGGPAAMSQSLTIRRLVVGIGFLGFLLTAACSNQPAPPASAFTPTPTPTRHVTFVQWTDPHVFDAGKGRQAEGVREEELDDWAAFHWAVLETNQLVLDEHKNIDFVAITGDFGLENVQLPDEPLTPDKNAGCANRKPGDDGPIEKIPLAEAAEEVARELEALLVKRVYLVPGNNDLCDENPKDLHRWARFVLALQQALATRHAALEARLKQSAGPHAPKVNAPAMVEVVDLSDTLARLYDGTGIHSGKNAQVLAMFPNGPAPPHNPPTIVNGIQLLGMDSAFFKDTKGKFGADVAAEMKWIRGQIHPGGSYLIFTHIPDLNDPFRVNPAYKPCWNHPGKACDDWQKNVMNQTGVLAMFAGHFHVADRSIYPHNFSYAKPDDTTAAKLWLAPPLAEKYQWRSPAEKVARGMLLVSVNADGEIKVSSESGGQVQSSALWYSTLNQMSAIIGDDKLAEARAAERDKQWETAANKYLSVLSTSGIDSRTQATALKGYLNASENMKSLWWRSSAARWVYFNLLPFLYSVGVIFALGVLLTLINALLKRLLRAMGYSGRAVISNTTELTTGAPVKEFTARLQAEGDEIKKRLILEREGWAASHITLLTPSGTSFDSLLSSIPKVESVNVSEWARFVVNLLLTFRWTVQTGLGVFPPNQLAAPGATPPAAGADVLVKGARLNAYAVLQWGWIVRVSWWRKRDVKDDRLVMEELARELAELILGEAFV